MLPIILNTIDMFLFINEKACIYLQVTETKKMIHHFISLIYIIYISIFSALFFSYLYFLGYGILSIQLNHAFIFPSISSWLLFFIIVICNAFIIKQSGYTITKYAILIQKLLYITRSNISKLIGSVKRNYMILALTGSVLAIFVTLLIVNPFLVNKIMINWKSLEILFGMLFLVITLLLMFGKAEVFPKNNTNLDSLILWSVLLSIISGISLAQIIEDFMNNYSSGIIGSLFAISGLIFSYATVLDKLKPFIYLGMAECSLRIDEDINQKSILIKNDPIAFNDRFYSFPLFKKVIIVIRALVLILIFLVIIMNINTIVVKGVSFISSLKFLQPVFAIFFKIIVCIVIFLVAIGSIKIIWQNIRMVKYSNTIKEKIKLIIRSLDYSVLFVIMLILLVGMLRNFNKSYF